MAKEYWTGMYVHNMDIRAHLIIQNENSARRRRRDETQDNMPIRSHFDRSKWKNLYLSAVYDVEAVDSVGIFAPERTRHRCHRRMTRP